uniref:V-type proton ATPase subunit a n=2 Tax=Compsopogon caeruleus TaxID=31354 RepID=A0A7S1TIV0_9RHOD
MVQFKDLNPDRSSFQRAFSNDIKRCDEMQRRLRFLEVQVTALDLGKVEDVGDMDMPVRLDDLDLHLHTMEKNILEMNDHWNSLNQQHNELVELRHVLEKAAEFFHDAPRAQSAAYGSLGILDPIGGDGSGSFRGRLTDVEPSISGLRRGWSTEVASNLLSFYTGVIGRERVASFERILFRATRGNCFVRFAEISEQLTDPSSGEMVKKSVFVVFFSGNEIRVKVGKICAAFNASRYPFPEEHHEQVAALASCQARLLDLSRIIETTSQQRANTLSDVAGKLESWKWVVKREKSIYHTLNLFNFDTSNKLFYAEGWCPVDAIGDIRQALETGRRKSNAQVPSVLEERSHGHETPPTHFKTNRFTQVFQSIVEAYGVAQYHEVNPAPFSIATFPFLFAVMFGDVGHGTIMTLFALYLILAERRLAKQKLNEIMGFAYTGRYIIFLMGLFSIYTGLIYNEVFAIPVDLFRSRWKFTEGNSMACGINECDDPKLALPPANPYPLGFDPIWKGSDNGLVFFNSYKMKLSIIFGVAQMVLGICLSYMNAKFFKEPLDVFYQFIPQMILMNSIFGYLVVLIILKWSINWNSDACKNDPTCIAPDLKNVLIGMFMSPGHVPDELRLYRGQGSVQLILLGLALISVPWMLFPKPLLLKARHDKARGYRPLSNEVDTVGHVDDDEVDHTDHGKPFDFVDAFVNQMIHTIEFVLGTVSNTASYLRLWALSLAHAQLSDVFLEKVLLLSLSTGNVVAIAIGFSVWFGATMGVLMGMESLSAFLHALRLHWVEFQNKFYNLHGAGTKFIPYSYTLLQAEEEA